MGSTGHIDFVKMHGLGNDFAIFDARSTPIVMTPNMAARLAHRQTGIGCDQLILLEPSDGADLKMRIFNADGGEVEACGNATRAVAMLLGGSHSIETRGGMLHVSAQDAGASVQLPAPKFAWDNIPLAYAMDTAALPVSWNELSGGMCVNVGNPHVIFFVEDVDAIALDMLGPQIEQDALFPERINVNIAQITGPNSLKLRVWERGAGLTLACGTGACATAVAAIQSKRVTGPVTVSLPGGDLIIDWSFDPSKNKAITMTGGATLVYRGQIDLADFV
jgi:diaminopimelate epimerase